MIDEGKKQRRQNRAQPVAAVPTVSTPPSAGTEFAYSKMFPDTAQRHFQNSTVQQRFLDFIEHKRANPMLPFGKKDRPLGEGPLQGVIHAGLTFDISVFYEIRGRNPHTIYLYFVATHDESGTEGGGKRLNVQRAWADRVADARKTEFKIENQEPDQI